MDKDKDAMVLAAIHTEEGKQRLGEALHVEIRKARAKRAQEPLCHRVYHPFLGRAGFMSS